MTEVVLMTEVILVTVMMIIEEIWLLSSHGIGVLESVCLKKKRKKKKIKISKKLKKHIISLENFCTLIFLL